MSAPAISVVMPVYNGEDYILDSVASILQQSLTDWELLAINDGSQDQTPAILDWFGLQDSRIRVIHQNNTGLVGALNRGFELAKAPLVLRMDHDDLALPNRMATQLQFMDQNPDCVVCGGAIMEMDADGELLGESVLPQDHEAIVENLLTRRTGHFHPTTLIRKSAFERTLGYQEKYRHIEDHDLWLQLSEVGELANLSDVTLCYRLHEQSVCWRQADFRREQMNSLMDATYQRLGLEPVEGAILEKTIQRHSAGPGKWARAAAKRGKSRAATKHLRRLRASDAEFAYKLRMTIETNLRLLTAQAKQLIKRENSSNAIAEAPGFPDWQARWQSRNQKKAA